MPTSGRRAPMRSWGWVASSRCGKPSRRSPPSAARVDAPRIANSLNGAAMGRPLSRSVIEEPRGSRSAVGEVEQPQRHPQSPAPLRAKTGPQGDAGRPHASRGTHEAPSPRRNPCAGATLARRRARASRDEPWRPRERAPQRTGARAATAGQPKKPRPERSVRRSEHDQRRRVVAGRYVCKAA